MKALMVVVCVSMFFSVAYAKSYDCTSEDKKLSVHVRPMGSAIEGGIPSTVEVLRSGASQIYSPCEQRYTQMHGQEIVGISCDLGKAEASVGLGIFLPELDGFIETIEQEVIDIQCVLVGGKESN